MCNLIEADEHIWRTIEGKFKTISIAPHICASAKYPSGMAPYGHFGDGCINIILESSLGLSKLIPIKVHRSERVLFYQL